RDFHVTGVQTCALPISDALDVTPPPSWVPFAPRPLQALRRSYGPSDSCRGGASAHAEPVHRPSPLGRSPSFTNTSLVTIPSPTTGSFPAVAFARYPSARQAHWFLPASDFASARQTRRRARPNRVRLLRTGHSPPEAPHPASRRRSFRWFQAGERLPGKDLHLPGCVRSEAHRAPRFARAGGVTDPER